MLWHVPPDAGTRGDHLLIGLYSTRAAALAAVARLSAEPGFADHPELVDDTDDSGFFVEPYTVDEDHWTEGYRAEPV